jgi:tocopherol O-methyltransferase
MTPLSPQKGDSVSKEQIIDYYVQCHKDYEDAWRIHVNYSLHYGYHDENHRHHDSAVINMNRVLSQKAGISKQDRVLDAGCGIGGSSMWLAKNTGAQVVGVSLVPMQVELARSLAAKNGVAHQTQFEVGDYTELQFPPQSFDVVWGLESICYAENKISFLREAFRLLKPGGRIVVADGFIAAPTLGEKQQKIVDGFCEGWALPNLATREGFRRDLDEVGFRHVAFEDISAHTLPSCKRLMRDFLMFFPIAKYQQWTGKRSAVQMKNLWTSYYQYRLFTSGIGCYGIFNAVK